jgi:ferric-dicitrate binding protein FerR (iron transport regulator)
MEPANNIWESIIIRHLSGELNPEEQANLMNWLASNPKHQSIYNDIKKTWDLTVSYPELNEEDINMKQNWNSISNRIHVLNEIKKPSRILQFRYIKYAAAAVLAIMVLSWLFISKNDDFSQDLMVINTLTASRHMIVLPDQSKVWLHKGAEISFSKDFDDRNINLKGEAFFDVTHDPLHPFEVFTAGTSVKVLGTRFHLSTDEAGNVNLHVDEGKVAFTINENEKSQLIVSKNKAATADMDNQTIIARENYDRNMLEWYTGELIFNHDQMSNVIATLERVYNIEIEIEDKAVLGCAFKGSFKKASLDEILHTIAFSLGIEYSLDQETYLLKGKGCINDKSN